MTFDNLVNSAKVYFPNLQIKYKNESLFMKILSILLFFNPKFMTGYTNTFGNTVYFASRNYIIDNPVLCQTTLLHELVHMHDLKQKGSILYILQYGFPQILVLACLPLFFFFWKIALVLTILFLLPLPAYFRMQFEKRGYLCSLYCLNAFGKKYNMPLADIQNMLNINKQSFNDEFKSSAYYYMWMFNSINSDFDKGVNKIKAGLKPYDDDVFNMIDDLLSKT
jgi:hypothetical protein